MPTKVIQWGAGYTGAFALRYLINSGAYELVGVKCFTEAKEGMDAGDIAGLAPIGIAATRDTETLLQSNADVVIYMPRDPFADPSLPGSPSRGWYDELRLILASGKNVITSLCSGTHYRHLADPEGFVSELNEACALGSSSVVFFGLDPGFFTDLLPLTMTSVVGEITQVRTYEIVPYDAYPEVEVLSSLGFGADPHDLGPEGIEPLRVTWGCAPYLLAEATGVDIDNIDLDVEIALAPETFTTPGGMTIEQDTIAGIRFAISGLVEGVPRFVVNHVTRMRSDIAPEWPDVAEGRGGYRIEIDSFPPFVGEFPMALPGGTGSTFADAVAMTAAHCVSAIDAIVAATPGYKTFLDLKPIVGRHTNWVDALSVE